MRAIWIRRFEAFGAIKKLQGPQPPEFRLRSGDWRICFHRKAGAIIVLRVQNWKQAHR